MRQKNDREKQERKEGKTERRKRKQDMSKLQKLTQFHINKKKMETTNESKAKQKPQKNHKGVVGTFVKCWRK